MQTSSGHITSDNCDRFPAFQLFVLALCRIAEPIALTSIFPYAFPMVKGFLGDENPNNALYTGILISSFSLAEAATGVFWGTLSDRVGRKPVLLLGLFGTLISLLMTGIATSFTFALLARLLGGMLNGNMGVIQTMVGELVRRPEHEPRAFAVMPFVWCIGSILGPAIAGVTSDSSLFPDYPYLLPNVIGAAFLFAGIVVGFFFLEETLQKDHVVPEEKTPLMLASENVSEQNEQDDQRTESYGTFNWVNLDRGDDQATQATVSNHVKIPDEKGTVIFTKRVMLMVSALCLYCCHTMIYDHLLPIFMQDQQTDSTSTDHYLSFGVGGLGMSTQDVGIVMAVNGFIALLIQGIVFPLMTDLLGIWHTFAIVTLLHPIAYFIMPCVVLLSVNLISPGIYACLIVRNLFYVPAYPILLILIKEAANPKHLGKVNGLAASAGAVARMIGPPLGGLMYGWGRRIGFASLGWYGAGLVAMVGSAQVIWIKRNKNAHSTLLPPFNATNEAEPA